MSNAAKPKKKSKREMPPLSPSEKEYLIPIIIGVTGHRDLRPQDIPYLEGKVREVFQKLQEDYPNTPLQVLSPLAEGADRLVARIALEFQAKLIVPLSMPREEFEKDFVSPGSKAEFAVLLDKAEAQFELPLVEGNTLENIQGPGHNRDLQYEQIGKYIASHSQILIALWDGVYLDAIGGTSKIISFKLGDPKMHQLTIDPIESGPVYQIVTPRIKNLSPKGGELFSLHKHFPGGKVDDEEYDRAYLYILERMDNFNQDGRQVISDRADLIAKSKGYLVNDNIVPALPKTARETLKRYALSDAAAIRFQKKRVFTMRGLFFLVGFAVIFLECYDGLVEPLKQHLVITSLLPVYLLLIGVAFAWNAFAQFKEYQNKHLEYRALAEGLRVQFFWELAGIEDDASRHYLREQKSELEWIRNAVRSSAIPAENFSEILARRIKCHYWLIMECWVNDQAKYFHKSGIRDDKHLKQLEWFMKILIGGGLFLAGAVSVIDFFLKIEAEKHIHIFSRIIMKTIPVIGAAFGGYAMKMALAEQVKHYERMHGIYDQASRKLFQLIDHNDHESVQSILCALGEEALIENGDWLLLHRERPMEVPLGG